MSHTMGTYRGFVFPWVIDQVGHRNGQSYVGRFGESSGHFLASLGLSPTRLETSQKSFALDQRTQYKLEVLAGTRPHISSELLEMKWRPRWTSGCA